MSMTVPVRPVPPTTALVETLMADTQSPALTARLADAPAQLPTPAVIAADAATAPGVVEIAKSVDTFPSGMVTVAGT